MHPATRMAIKSVQREIAGMEAAKAAGEAALRMRAGTSVGLAGARTPQDLSKAVERVAAAVEELRVLAEVGRP